MCLFTSRWGREALATLMPDEPQVFEMRDYFGPDRGLCREDEETLKEFLEDSGEIGVPRTKGRCATDIQEYIRQENLFVPFKDHKPGKFIHNIIMCLFSVQEENFPLV